MPDNTIPVANPMVLKRDGRLQAYSGEKLLHSLRSLSWDLSTSFLDLDALVDAVTQDLTTQISSRELSFHVAATAAASATKHPDYSILAGRLHVAMLHKYTPKSFVEWAVDNGTGENAVLSPEIARLASMYGSDLDDALVHGRDFGFTYSSIRSLMHSYLMHVNGRVIERPQHMFMRVALTAHGEDRNMVLRTYDALSRRSFTFATPVLANAGTLRPHYASCFLHAPDTDGPDDMLRCAHDMDLLWLADGGIGLSLGDVPCQRPGWSVQPGVLPLMKVIDAHADYTSLWRGTRPSAATVYLPVWHGDVMQFIACRTSRAGPNERVKNIFVGLWLPDVFMQRTEADGLWSLFDPADVPALNGTYGDVFKVQYEGYEATNRAVTTLPARDLWAAICRAQEESGVPFLIYQDAVNRKNNQSHLGVIQTSNLCTEIMQYAAQDHTAVCTLASVALPRFVRRDGSYDFEGLHEVTKLAVRGANALIDAADYPTSESSDSAITTRALGIGAQGLADAFMASRMPFDSPQARALNVAIFETIYHGAYEASCELAADDGFYPLYPGSPASQGIMQHDMWPGTTLSDRYDFVALRARIDTHGLRNSMLTAQMPTASTARLLGNFDGTEPYTSNVVVHRVLSGDFTELCRWLVLDLERLGLWTEEVRVAVLKGHGSIQAIPGIPDDLKQIYKTVWEIGPDVMVDMAADRGPFIDQSQSMTLHVARPSVDEMIRLQLRAWRRGLKTGLYYLRTRAPAYPLPYGVGNIPVPTKAEVTQHAAEEVYEECQECCSA